MPRLLSRFMDWSVCKMLGRCPSDPWGPPGRCDCPLAAQIWVLSQVFHDSCSDRSPKHFTHSHPLTLAPIALPNHSVKPSSSHTSSTTWLCSYQPEALFPKKSTYLLSIPFMWQLNPFQMLSCTIMKTSSSFTFLLNSFHQINKLLKHQVYLLSLSILVPMLHPRLLLTKYLLTGVVSRGGFYSL